MIRKALFLTLISTIIASCVSGPRDTLKKSANGKYFDRKGFHGGKRMPLYNKKYVGIAKKNILKDNLSEDAYEDLPEEDENPIQNNINNYRKIIEDEEKKKLARQRKQSRYNKKVYPSVYEADMRIDPETHKQNLELKKELMQIKQALEKTQADLKKQQDLLNQKKKYESAQEEKSKIQANQKALESKKKTESEMQSTHKKLENTLPGPPPSSAKSSEIIEPKNNIHSL